MIVSETFFSLGVRDMARATKFYADALGATVAFASPGWSSLVIAGVRIGLFPERAAAPLRSGLHFVVGDLDAALEAIARAGGQVVEAAHEVATDVVIALVADTEGNAFALRKASAD